MKKLLLLLLIVGCSTEPDKHGCLDSQAYNYDSTASIDNNSCTYIDSCGVVDMDRTNDCILDIYYESPLSFGGFQFDVAGVSIISAYGGVSEPWYFLVESSQSTVLGFSQYADKNIPLGEGILIKLEVTGNIPNACLENVIIASTEGNPLAFTIENCNKIIIVQN